jgi:hypothetical protein
MNVKDKRQGRTIPEQEGVGSQRQLTGLSKGEHLLECCIHPWMRVKVEVK